MNIVLVIENFKTSWNVLECVQRIETVEALDWFWSEFYSANRTYHAIAILII